MFNSICLFPFILLGNDVIYDDISQLTLKLQLNLTEKVQLQRSYIVNSEKSLNQTFQAFIFFLGWLA